MGFAVDVALAATLSWLILGVGELLLSPFFLAALPLNGPSSLNMLANSLLRPSVRQTAQRPRHGQFGWRALAGQHSRPQRSRDA